MLYTKLAGVVKDCATLLTSYCVAVSLQNTGMLKGACELETKEIGILPRDESVDSFLAALELFSNDCLCGVSVG